MNVVALVGRLTKDVELRKTTNDKSVVNFCIAVNRAGKDQPADFINCVAWNKTAEFIANYFGKGKKIAVEGSIQTRSWQDQNGNNRYATEVLARQVGFVESKNGGGSAENQSHHESMNETQFDGTFEAIEDDVPF